MRRAINSLVVVGGWAMAAAELSRSDPTCIKDCFMGLTGGTSITEVTRTCQDVPQQRSLFLCLGSLCDAQTYGPALANAITTCMSVGAHISMLHPVEIQYSKLHARQAVPLSSGPALLKPCLDDGNGSTGPGSLGGVNNNGNNNDSNGNGNGNGNDGRVKSGNSVGNGDSELPELDPDFSVTLDCTAGLDGVVTLSNPSAARPTPGLSGNGQASSPASGQPPSIRPATDQSRGNLGNTSGGKTDGTTNGSSPGGNAGPGGVDMSPGNTQPSAEGPRQGQPSLSAPPNGIWCPMTSPGTDTDEKYAGDPDCANGPGGANASGQAQLISGEVPSTGSQPLPAPNVPIAPQGSQEPNVGSTGPSLNPSIGRPGVLPDGSRAPADPTLNGPANVDADCEPQNPPNSPGDNGSPGRPVSSNPSTGGNTNGNGAGATGPSTPGTGSGPVAGASAPAPARPASGQPPLQPAPAPAPAPAQAPGPASGSPQGGPPQQPGPNSSPGDPECSEGGDSAPSTGSGNPASVSASGASSGMSGNGPGNVPGGANGANGPNRVVASNGPPQSPTDGSSGAAQLYSTGADNVGGNGNQDVNGGPAAGPWSIPGSMPIPAGIPPAVASPGNGQSQSARPGAAQLPASGESSTNNPGSGGTGGQGDVSANGSGSTGSPGSGAPMPLINYDSANGQRGGLNRQGPPQGIGTGNSAPGSPGAYFNGDGSRVDNSPGPSPQGSQNGVGAPPGSLNGFLGSEPPSYGLFGRSSPAFHSPVHDADPMRSLAQRHEASAADVTLFPVPEATDGASAGSVTFLTARLPSESPASPSSTRSPIEVTVVSPAKDGSAVTMVSTFHDLSIPGTAVFASAKASTDRLHRREQVTATRQADSASEESSGASTVGSTYQITQPMFIVALLAGVMVFGLSAF